MEKNSSYFLGFKSFIYACKEDVQIQFVYFLYSNSICEISFSSATFIHIFKVRWDLTPKKASKEKCLSIVELKRELQ